MTFFKLNRVVAVAFTLILFLASPAPANDTCPDGSSEQFKALLYLMGAREIRDSLLVAIEDPSIISSTPFTLEQLEGALARVEKEMERWYVAAVSALLAEEVQLADIDQSHSEQIMKLLDLCESKFFNERHADLQLFIESDHYFNVFVGRALELEGNQEAAAELDEYFQEYDTTRCGDALMGLYVSEARLAELVAQDLLTLFIGLQESSGQEEEGKLRQTWKVMRTASEDKGLFGVRGFSMLWPETIGRNYEMGYAQAFGVLSMLREDFMASPLWCAKRRASSDRNFQVALEYGEIRYERYQAQVERYQRDVESQAD